MSYYLERIQRGVDFIEGRLDDDITLQQVAKAGGLSLWHFQRIFKALTGDTLKNYVRSRRLALALERLLTTKLRVLDIALSAGFESQEAFARAFKVGFGISPLQARTLGRQSPLQRKPQFDAAYLAQLERNAALEPELREHLQRTFVGVRTLVFGSGSEKNNFSERLPPLWGEFIPRMESIPLHVPGVAYGVICQQSEDDAQLEYFAASEVTALTTLPPGMAQVNIPAASYATFPHRGPAQDLDRTVTYIYSTWLARSERRHAGGPDLEIYGPDYHPTSNTSLIYYAIPLAP